MKYRGLFFFAAAIFVFPFMALSGAPASFTDIDISSAKAPGELQALTERLNAASRDAVQGNSFSREAQGVVLKKTGECIDKAVSFHGKPGSTGEQERKVFLGNRELIKKVLDLNKKILEDYQEKLDTMENPLAFFKTPAWREPQQLVATASFRLGWNNYYASLLFPESDPLREELLKEAIENLSRSFVDAKEDRTVITSVFGRGLCRKQLKAYADALKDFDAVKKAVSKDDPMRLRCCYEEAQIIFFMGNHADVLRKIGEIDKDYPPQKIPEELKKGLKDLREASLKAIEEKAAGKGIDESAAPGGEIK